jgi:superfamily II DNA helicase RecQ
VESLTSELKCEYYHATKADKKDVLARFKKNDLQSLVTTSALGLKLDISNIRLIIHVRFLSSIIDFFQESGRAERDNKKAFSLIITPNNQLRVEVTRRIPYKVSEFDLDLFAKIDKVNINKFIYSSRCRRIVLNEVNHMLPSPVTHALFRHALILQLLEGHLPHRDYPPSFGRLVAETSG